MTTTTKQPLDMDAIRRRAEAAKDWGVRDPHTLCRNLADDVRALMNHTDDLGARISDLMDEVELLSLPPDSTWPEILEERDRLAAENAKLKAVVEPLRSVVTEVDVAGFLACHTQGMAVLEALAALDTTGGEE